MKKVLFLFLTSLIWQVCPAQLTKSGTENPRGIYFLKGDYYFDNDLAGIATAYYLNEINIKPGNALTMLHIAESYAAAGATERALNWYKKAFNETHNFEPEQILKYVLLLFHNKMYGEAQNWGEIYSEKLKEQYSANQIKDTTIYALEESKGLNIQSEETSPYVYSDRLLFTSKSTDTSANGQQLYKIFEVVASANNDIRPFHNEINKVAVGGHFSISEKSGLMYFDGNADNPTTGSTHIYYCDIPQSRDDKVKIKQLRIKNFEREASHPAINSEGDVLYFAAKSETTGRGLDIYKSEGKGRKWSEPKPLGVNINSEGDDCSPFLYNDSIMYFASNGHDGNGGFDIYSVNLLDENAPIENLGQPVNTESDESAIFIAQNAEEGWLSSNNPEGNGKSDLYKIHLLNLKTTKAPQGVNNNDFNKPLSISIYASGGDEVNLIGRVNENIAFSISPGINYQLFIDKDNYKEVSNSPTENIVAQIEKETPGPIELTFQDEYNFLINKYVKTGTDGFNIGYNTVLKDLQALPGDLITFRFIPNKAAQHDNAVLEKPTKINFMDRETTVQPQDTLVFGYVVEEAPEELEEQKHDLIADLNNKSPDTLAKDAPLAEVSTSGINDSTEVVQNESPVDSTIASQEDNLDTNDLVAAQIDTNDVRLNEHEKDSLQQITTTDTIEDTDSVSNDSESSSDAIAALEAKASEPEQTDDKEAEQVVDSLDHLENQLAEAEQMADSLKDEDISNDPGNSLADATPTTSIKDDVSTREEINIEAQVAESNEDEQVQYRVQIAASRKPLDDSYLKKIYKGNRTIKQFTKDNYYKYYIAEVPVFDDANKIRLESGVEGAFIVKHVIEDTDEDLFSGPSENNSGLLANADPETSAGNMESTIPQQDDSTLDLPPINAQHNNEVATDTTTNTSEEKLLTMRSPTIEEIHQEDTDNELKTDNTEEIDNTEQANKSLDPEETNTTNATDSQEVIKQGDNYDAHDFKYRVQIAASKTALDHIELEKIYSGPLVIRHFIEEGYFKYYIAEVPSYFEARKILHESEVIGGFIVPYTVNSKWDLEDAIHAQYKARMVKSGLNVPGDILDINIVNFEFDEFILLPEERSRLDSAVIEKLKADEELYAIVNGHTDIRGSDPYNFGLSEERATFVRQLIIEEGIDQARVETHYFGESKLAKFCSEHENCNESVHRVNRRVEVILLER